MHTVLNSGTLSYLVILLFLSATPSRMMAQSPYETGIEYVKKREYDAAKSAFRKAIDYYKSEGLTDSVILAYKDYQYCYTNTFKLDSAKLILRDGADYARQYSSDSIYMDFKIAEAEIYYITGQLDTARVLFLELLDYSDAIDYFNIRLNFRLSSIAHMQQDSQMAFQRIRSALEDARTMKDSSMLGSIYSGMASMEADFGDKKKAIGFYLDALPFLQHPTKAMILASNYRKIAYLFQDIGNIKKTKEYAMKAFDVASEKKFRRELAYINSLLGEIALAEEDYSKAIDYFNGCISYFESKKLEDYILMAYVNMAMAYMKSDQLARAREYIRKAEPYVASNQVVVYRFQYYHVAASIAYASDNKKQMSAYLERCRIMLPELMDQRDILKFYKLQSAYFKLSGNYKSAMEFNNRYHNLRDSLFRLEQTQIIHELEAKYQKSEQDREIELLSAENQFSASMLEQQKIIIYGGMLGLLIMALLSFSSYRLYRKVKNQNEIVSSALEVKDTLLREIHHRVKNNLQIISSLLALQSKYISDDEALKALQQGQDRVQTMALIHQDLYETESLSGVTADSYVHQLTDKLMESYNYDESEIDVIVEVDDIILDLDTMIPLGLIINELVSNAFKHAFNNIEHKPSIQIKLFEKGQALRLEVSDNGKGIRDISELEGQSFGFELVKAFTKKLKADIRVHSDNGLHVKLLIDKYGKLK